MIEKLGAIVPLFYSCSIYADSLVILGTWYTCYIYLHIKKGLKQYQSVEKKASYLNHHFIAIYSKYGMMPEELK